MIWPSDTTFLKLRAHKYICYYIHRQNWECIPVEQGLYNETGKIQENKTGKRETLFSTWKKSTKTSMKKTEKLSLFSLVCIMICLLLK